jgi:hypothetical protein
MQEEDRTGALEDAFVVNPQRGLPDSGAPGRHEHPDEDFWDGFYGEEESAGDAFGCVLGDECIVADPIHLSSECHTAEDAEEYHRTEWLRSEVLEHGACPEGALVLEKAIVGILASATVAGDGVMAAEDCAPYRRLLFQRWPGIARAALAHEAPSDNALDEPDADPRLLERMMDLREALHWLEDYGHYSTKPDLETYHGVCVEVPDFVKRALEGRPEDGGADAAEDGPGWEPTDDEFSDLPF